MQRKRPSGGKEVGWRQPDVCVGILWWGRGDTELGQCPTQDQARERLSEKGFGFSSQCDGKPIAGFLA